MHYNLHLIMDIPVSKLNKRMAMQVPAELPLGLVFVVGTVGELAPPDEENGSGHFCLLDSGYQIRCQLSERAAGETSLSQGDLIRAGGHLAFEPSQAGYFLIARDVEVLEEYRQRPSLAEVAVDMGDQPVTMGLAPAEMPPWVRQLAPPEVRQELALQAAADARSDVEHAAESWDELIEAEATLAYPAEDPALAGLSDELIAFLSEAMDSADDIELTPELVASLSWARRNAGSELAAVDGERPDGDGRQAEAAVPERRTEAPSAASSAEGQEQTMATPAEVIAETPTPEVAFTETTAVEGETTLIVSESVPPADDTQEPARQLLTSPSSGESRPPKKTADKVSTGRQGERQEQVVPAYIVMFAIFIFLVFMGFLAIVIRFFI